MPPITWAEFTSRLLSLYVPPLRSPRTRSKMRTVLSRAAAIGATSTASLTTEFLARFAAERAKVVGANTVRGDLSYLGAATGYALEEGWIRRRPNLMRVRPRPTRSALPKCHTLEEVGRVLELLGSRSETWQGARLYALTATAAMTAARRDELLYMRVEDVRLDQGVIEISDRRRLKTFSSSAPVPICPDLAAILAAWLPRTGPEWLFPGVRGKGPWTGGSVSGRAGGRLKAAGEDAGIQGLTFQSLRQTFATLALRHWGLNPTQVADILRHTSPATTARWYLSAARQADLVNSVKGVSYQIP